MPTQTAHRFTLQPYAGPKSRTACPACAKPRCFTQYIDTDTGELLPDEYGRCDHEVSCGYSVSPYTRPAWGGQSYATTIERGEQAAPYVAAPRPVPPAPAVVPIPLDVYRASLGHYDRNYLAGLLRQHFGIGIANDLIARFHLGTSAYWSGACVFWLLDERGQVRGGQVVLYDDTLHTVKKTGAEGKVYRCTRPVHTALARTYRQRGEAEPTWLANYAATTNPKSPCLFGLPQLATAPAGQPVAIVESAKTAILATPYFPRYIWLATMGLSLLTPDRLEPLRGRPLVLYPDAGALAQWQAKADKLRQSGFNVRVSGEIEQIANEITASEQAAGVPPDQQTKGIDLADVLLREWPGYPPSWDEKPESV